MGGIDGGNIVRHQVYGSDSVFKPHPKTKTDADRIRSMSDERLAEFIAALKYRKTQTTTWEGEYIEVLKDEHGNCFPSIKAAIEYELFMLQRPAEETDK